MQRVAIYARVSTSDKGQDPENQLGQLRAWCQRMGYFVAREYVEHQSGGKGTQQRPWLARLFADAARREFDMVLVWALDRFSRSGMMATDNELVRDMLLALLASLAKLERAKISERTKAGLERARAKGKRIGRPPLSAAKREKLRAALASGRSWRGVSAAPSIPYSTVQKHACQAAFFTVGAIRNGELVAR